MTSFYLTIIFSLVLNEPLPPPRGGGGAGTCYGVTIGGSPPQNLQASPNLTSFVDPRSSSSGAHSPCSESHIYFSISRICRHFFASPDPESLSDHTFSVTAYLG